MNFKKYECFDSFDFELDIAAIKPHSVSEKNVELPYVGSLPETFHDVASARILFNIQPIRSSSIVLIVTSTTGKETRYALSASTAEIKQILGKIFNGAKVKKSGMTPYWFCVWQVNYFNWVDLQSVPHLAGIVHDLPADDRARLFKMLRVYENTSRSA